MEWNRNPGREEDPATGPGRKGDKGSISENLTKSGKELDGCAKRVTG
jgi:hypothetical protein